MGFLRLLEGLRTSVGDVFFSVVTHLGEETVLILVGLLFFWCINKRQGYYLLTVGFMGTIINQFLKLAFRIPRPWVQDEAFTIVESARAEATGYSFPSGHTQTSVGLFGGIARSRKHLWVRVLCVAACVLVPLSRMYLGVHTPLDVGVSILIAVALVLGMYPLTNWAMSKKRNMRLLFGGMLLLSAAFLLFAVLYPFPADTDPHNLESGVKNAYKIIGCLIGLWIAYEIDDRYIRFDTKAVWWVQLLKLVLGLLPLLAIKSGLKEPLYALCGGSYVADAIRYFLLVAYAGCVWPLTFRFFARLSSKKE